MSVNLKLGGIRYLTFLILLLMELIWSLDCEQELVIFHVAINANFDAFFSN